MPPQHSQPDTAVTQSTTSTIDFATSGQSLADLYLSQSAHQHSESFPINVSMPVERTIGERGGWDFSSLRQLLEASGELPAVNQTSSSTSKLDDNQHAQITAADGITISTTEDHASSIELTGPSTDESATERPGETGNDGNRAIRKPKTSKALKKLIAAKSSQQEPTTTPNPTPNRAVKARHAPVRDRVERDLAFRLKLMQHFPEDRLTIARNVALQHHPGAKHMHVFIDYSNMFIGFRTFHQRRNPHAQPGPDQPRLCIESLIYLLERGRIVERRHLAGSKPWQAAYATAERVGYNCTILEKVAKPFYYSSDGKSHRGRPKSAELHVRSAWAAEEPASSTQYGSSPEKSITKFVEQGVDEILQLKMSLSIIDLKRAAQKTMVLATGDGAEAEYSDGFASMVERALDDGWFVELVSWEHCVSSIYFRKQWLPRWAPGQFRFIALDPFFDELQECK